MTSNRKLITILFGLCLNILLGCNLAVAETQEPLISDMRILIDVSGSMKQNDPNNLRAPALKLLVGLLPNNSRAGVWTFGKEVNMQVKLDDVTDAWKRYARNEAEKIHSFGLFTNIEDAISRATWDWKDPDPKYQRTLILLTDGVVDISRDAELNRKSRQRIISRLLPKLTNADVKVNTIALSENADHKLLQELATRTNGWYSSVSSADELKRKFLHLFEKSTQADSIPLKDNTFTVDKSVSEMTVLIFKTGDSVPTELVTPDGQALTYESKSEKLQWHQESGYDMITISKPAPGKWEAKAEIDPDNRVLVVTNLKLKSNSFNHNFLKGDVITIYADLEEDNKIIKKQEFMKLVTFNLQVNGKDNAYKLNDSGSIPDAKPQDGIFSSIVETAGLEESNDLLIEAKGATFDRQLRPSFKVFETPFTINVKDPVDEQPFDFSVTIKPYIFVKGSENIRVELPDGVALELKPSVNQRWETSIPSVYQGNNIQVNLTGKRYSHSEPYQYSESYMLPSMVKEDVVTSEPEVVMEAPVVLEKEVTVEEEQTPPKEITPALAPVTEEKKEDIPLAKTEPATPESAIVVEPESTPAPEQEANWFLVFLMVLVGNVILIAGAYYGYVFWKKKRDSVLSEDNASFDEDSAGADKGTQTPPAENEPENIIEDAASDEGSTENDAVATADESEAVSEQVMDSDPLISDEDEDILKQQFGIGDDETDDIPDFESLIKEDDSDEDILKQQLGIEEDESDEIPSFESLTGEEDIAAGSSDEPQQTPTYETPEEISDSESIEESGEAVTTSESEEALSVPSAKKTEEIPDIESVAELDETISAESTKETQADSVETITEITEENIEVDSLEETKEAVVSEAHVDLDENPDSESDIKIEDGSDELQDSVEQDAILSDPDLEIDNIQENSTEEVAQITEETIDVDSLEITKEAVASEPSVERGENPDSELDIEIEDGSDELQDSVEQDAILSDLDLDEDAILSDLDLEIENMNKTDKDELQDAQTNESVRDAKQ